MKSLSLTFFLLFFSQLLFSQVDSTGMWRCGAQISDGETFLNRSNGISVTNVVVVFLDFPDGRLAGGTIPTQDWQLDPLYISNLDAVFNMGYQSYDGNNFLRKARKLTYEQFWNIYFSENIYITDEAHPDWMSHGRFNLPPTGDIARAWGSFKDYFNEVSYGNLVIQPYQTHTQYSGIYNYGIVNQVDQDASGTMFVRPLLMNYEKLSDYRLPNPDPVQEQSILSDLLNHANTRLQQAFINREIDFDPSNYNGKILYVFAGGTNIIGGIAGNESVLFREKFIPNDFRSSDDQLLKYSVINGISIACHEFGHLLGWGHTHNGNYDIMNGSGKIMQNCPAHPNIIFKLQAGWISNDRIRKIRTMNQVLNLPPVELNGDCAVITIYGKPGYDNNWTHSEYFVIENRRMYARNDLTVKFDKKLVWQPVIPPIPPGFTGGCLITHYTSYNNFIAPTNNEYVKQKIINAVPNRSWDMLYDHGNSKDFFGVLVSGDPPSLYSVLNPNRTKSSFDLLTGLNISNISGNNDKTINFQNNYTIEEPPDYNAVLYSGMTLPDTLDIFDNVLFTFPTIFNRVINIQPGAAIDFINGSIIVGPNSNIVAEGTEDNRITFRGCGYGQYRLKFNGVVVGNRPPLTQAPYTKIVYCNFNNLFDSAGIVAATSPQSQDVPYIIENNNFDNINPKIRIIATNTDLILQSLKGNNSNIEIQVISSNIIRIIDKIEVLPGRILSFMPSYNNSTLQFNKDAVFEIKGGIIALRNSASEQIIFDKAPGESYWGGIEIRGGYGNFRYCSIKNSENSVRIYDPVREISIENCIFENNINYDINLSNFTFQTAVPHLIQNNNFKGNSSNISSIVCSNGSNVEILNNIFTDSRNYGICPSFVNNINIIENQIYAYTEASADAVAGIYCYSSEGQISCNFITNFINGIYLDNSSPKFYNNELTNNSIGLYLTNGSSPIMSPSVSFSNVLYDGGYNLIYNNLYEEIQCGNPSGLPLSLPVMIQGYNSIYDEVSEDCLVNLEVVLPFEYIITNNYWGINGPGGRICPDGQNIYYEPYLTVPPQLMPCYGEPDNNKQLTNQTFNHHNSFNPALTGSVKKDNLPISNDISQFIGKEIYEFLNLLHSFSLTADISNYENSAIDELSYDKINKLLINTITCDNAFYERTGNTGKRFSESKKTYGNLNEAAVLNGKSKLQSIEKIKKLLGLENINVNNLNRTQIIEIIDRVIYFKLWELSILNISCDYRPVNKIESRHKNFKVNKNLLPNSFKLYQNYPNPFNPKTKIKFELPKDIKVLIKVYDILGKEVSTPVNDFLKAGYHEFDFNGNYLASGIYFYIIEAGTFTDVKKMVLMK